MFHWNPDYSDGQKVPKIPVRDQARPSQPNSEAQSKSSMTEYSILY